MLGKGEGRHEDSSGETISKGHYKNTARLGQGQGRVGYFLAWFIVFHLTHSKEDEKECVGDRRPGNKPLAREITRQEPEPHRP